jgi:hypothetical protein
MCRKLTILICFFLFSCVEKLYKIEESNTGIALKENYYTFNREMSVEGSKIIDTTALYIEIFGKNSNESQRANPMIYRFHNDGYFKTDSYLFYGKFDDTREKGSVYYGGKFYIEGNNIFIERFYPSKGGKTKYYGKAISKGIVKNDSITIDFFGTKHWYIKKYHDDIFK